MKPTEKYFSDIDAECNECDWKGYFNEMTEMEDEDRVLICPSCGSENIYYFKMP